MGPANHLWNYTTSRFWKILFAFDSAIFEAVYGIFNTTLRPLGGAEQKIKTELEKPLSENEVIARGRTLWWSESRRAEQCQLGNDEISFKKF